MDEALTLIRSETGTAFDPQCVDALLQILGQNVACLPPGDEPPSPDGLTNFDRLVPGDRSDRRRP
jgi:hypothetical protein